MCAFPSPSFCLGENTRDFASTDGGDVGFWRLVEVPERAPLHPLFFASCRSRQCPSPNRSHFKSPPLGSRGEIGIFPQPSVIILPTRRTAMVESSSGFTTNDVWKGGHYELLILLSERSSSELCSLLKALWSFPSLDGCYVRDDCEPATQLRVQPCWARSWPPIRPSGNAERTDDPLRFVHYGLRWGR
jgi:hypothetical protein